MASKLSLGKRKAIYNFYDYVQGVGETRSTKIAKKVNDEILRALSDKKTGIVAVAREVINSMFSPNTAKRLIYTDAGLPNLLFRKGLTDDSSVILACNHPAAYFIETGTGNSGSWIVPKKAKALKIKTADMDMFGNDTVGNGGTGSLLGTRQSLWNTLLNKRNDMENLSARVGSLARIKRRAKESDPLFITLSNTIEKLRNELADKTSAYKTASEESRGRIKKITAKLKYDKQYSKEMERGLIFRKRVRAPKRVPFLMSTFQLWSMTDHRMVVDIGQPGKRLLVETELVRLKRWKVRGI